MEGVAGGDHHRPARDLLAAETVGVAAAVEALVRGADQWRNRGEEGDPVQHPGGDRGVLVYPLALGEAQRPRLLQLAGCADLVDVVEQGAVAEAVELGAGEAEPTTDLERGRRPRWRGRR